MRPALRATAIGALLMAGIAAYFVEAKYWMHLHAIPNAYLEDASSVWIAAVVLGLAIGGARTVFKAWPHWSTVAAAGAIAGLTYTANSEYRDIYGPWSWGAFAAEGALLAATVFQLWHGYRKVA